MAEVVKSIIHVLSIWQYPSPGEYCKLKISTFVLQSKQGPPEEFAATHVPSTKQFPDGTQEQEPSVRVMFALHQ